MHENIIIFRKKIFYISCSSLRLNPIDARGFLMMPQQDWHFYSTDPSEKDTFGINDGHWIGNQSFWAPKKEVPGTIAVYRCFNKAWLNHFWSTTRDELAGKAGFVDEGEAFFVFTTQLPGTVPLKRFTLRAGTVTNIHHFYTATPSENPEGWVAEGFLGYVYETAPDPSVLAVRVYRDSIAPRNWVCELVQGSYVKFAFPCDNMFSADAVACCQQHLNITSQQTGVRGLTMHLR